MLKNDNLQGKKILIATGNRDKFKEISNFFSDTSIKIVDCFDLNLLEPEEYGDSFSHNSLIKAKYYGDKTNCISLADDSGLCVDVLNNMPGIYSARWAINDGKKDFNFAFNRIKKMLINMGINIKEDKISAYFVCALTIYNPDTQFYKIFEGKVEGYLNFDLGGIRGFGYDPIFVPHGCSKSFAQMSINEKDRISHRGNAFRDLIKWYGKK